MVCAVVRADIDFCSVVVFVARALSETALFERDVASDVLRSRTAGDAFFVFVVRETTAGCGVFVSDLARGRVVDTFWAIFRRVPARAISDASSATAG